MQEGLHWGRGRLEPLRSRRRRRRKDLAPSAPGPPHSSRRAAARRLVLTQRDSNAAQALPRAEARPARPAASIFEIRAFTNSACAVRARARSRARDAGQENGAPLGDGARGAGQEGGQAGGTGVAAARLRYEISPQVGAGAAWAAYEEEDDDDDDYSDGGGWEYSHPPPWAPAGSGRPATGLRVPPAPPPPRYATKSARKSAPARAEAAYEDDDDDDSEEDDENDARYAHPPAAAAAARPATGLRAPLAPPPANYIFKAARKSAPAQDGGGGKDSRTRPATGLRVPPAAAPPEGPRTKMTARKSAKTRHAESYGSDGCGDSDEGGGHGGGGGARPAEAWAPWNDTSGWNYPSWGWNHH